MSSRISLLATGGTISTGPSSGGAVPRLTAEQISSGLPEGLRNSTTIRTRDVMAVSSRAMTPEAMWALADAVAEEVRDGADGIVVTHGTDTLEETAYALALLLDVPVPVVLTGAMRPPHAPGADGPANLASALAAAAFPALSGYGPVVVMHDEVHVARWVTKTHSTRLGSFASPAAGAVGTLVEGRVELLLGPHPVTDRLPRAAPPDKRVELLWATAGSDGYVVEAIGPGLDGLVVAGTGGGHVGPELAQALVALVERGCPVVLSSRCGAAPQVLTSTYGSVGSEAHLLSSGLVAAGSLAPLKARLRLLFGLSAGLAATELFPEGGRQ